MKDDDLQDCLDLHRADLDLELFAAALAVQHIRRLIAAGGSEFGRPEDEETLPLDHLKVFLARAVETAHTTGRFEQAWRRLQRLMPSLQAAWERGQTLFREALTRATSDEEDMGYLFQIDFAVDCYAYLSALNTYPHDRVLQAWAINGYMGAWRQHFLAEEDASR